jgi:alkylated DNA repair dioxygenase AlkB
VTTTSGAPTHGTVRQRPAGLVYQPELIDEAEERHLLRVLGRLQLRDVRRDGSVTGRSVRHFGADAEPVPGQEWAGRASGPPALDRLRERCAALLGVTAETLGQVLVTRYAPGAVLDWHRYPRTLGPTVIGLSLATRCLLRFQHRADERCLVFEQPLAPRSAYVMAGPARARWEHSIPPVPGLRYSITFRTEGQQD